MGISYRPLLLLLFLRKHYSVVMCMSVCVCGCVQLLCVRAFSSLFVCLCVCSCPVRSFVAGAINSPPKSSAPVVHSFADILGLSLVYMPTLHVVEKY